MAAGRPTRSDSHAQGSTDNANPRVAAETVSAARDGLTAASVPIWVSNPCGAYIRENVATPAQPSAADSRSSGPPAEWDSSIPAGAGRAPCPAGAETGMQSTVG